MAYCLIEPFGQDRADDGARLIASILYNVNRGKDAPPLAPSDFLRTWRPQEAVDQEAVTLQMAAWFDAMG